MALARMDVGYSDGTVSTVVLVHVDGRDGKRVVREDHFYAHRQQQDGGSVNRPSVDTMLAKPHRPHPQTSGEPRQPPGSVALGHTLVRDWTAGTSKLLLARTETPSGAAAPATCLTQPLVSQWPLDGAGGVLHAWVDSPDAWEAWLGVDMATAEAVRLRGVPAVWLTPDGDVEGDMHVAADVLLHCDGGCAMDAAGAWNWRPLMVIVDDQRTNYTLLDWRAGCDAVEDAQDRFARMWLDDSRPATAMDGQSSDSILAEVRHGTAAAAAAASAALFDVHGWRHATEGALACGQPSSRPAG